MVVLDVGVHSLFSHSTEFLSIIGSVLKLLAGSFGILLLTSFSFIGIVVASVYKAIEHSSLLRGFRFLIRGTAYAIGLSVALVFILVTGIFFSIPFLKLLVIAFLITLLASFIARETFLFLILKRFGKYIFYLTTLHRFSKAAYIHVKKENQNNPAQNQPD